MAADGLVPPRVPKKSPMRPPTPGRAAAYLEHFTSQETMMPPTAILLTTHCWNSKRKAGFHWIADSLHRLGWRVYFVTDGLSAIDKLRGCYRFQCLPDNSVNRIVKQKDHLFSYVIYHWWRPVRLPSQLLTRLANPWFASFGKISLGPLEPLVATASLCVFESSMGLFFFRRFKSLNGSARYVYRVSDDLHVMTVPSILRRVEAAVAPEFDLISVPTKSIYDKFAHLSMVRLQRHGVPLHLYDAEHRNPYPPHTQNAVFVGNNSLDVDFIGRACRLCKEIRFHLIGPIGGLPACPNLIAYGEMPYEDTVRYVKFADIGLAPRTIPSLADSNKIIQYSYVRLPVIASEINRDDKPNVFYYRPGDDDSIVASIRQALAYDRTSPLRELPRSWDALAQEIIGRECCENPTRLVA